MRCIRVSLAFALAACALPLKAGEAESAAPIIANPDKPPVEIVYTDGIDCAAYSGMMAVLLENRPGYADKAEYFDKVGDLWLDALIRSDPSKREQVLADFQVRIEAVVDDFKTQSDKGDPGAAIAALIEANGDKCLTLERGIFGND